MAYLALDTELGGPDPLKYSLLTAFFAIFDDSFKEVDHLLLTIKPDDGIYIVSPQGMEINGINLTQHDINATTIKASKTLLYNFIFMHSRRGLLTPVGHGVHSDIRAITNCLMSKQTWDSMVEYRTLDTGTISRFLMQAGKMPNMDASLEVLAEYFHISYNKHTADGDALASAAVLHKMMKLI